MAQEKPEAYILKLEGMITRADVITVEKYINQARQDGIRTFILELDTPGGTVQASMDLGDFIFQLDDIDVIAYVHNQAYSGGTMVALACKAIYIDDAVGKLGDVAPVGPTGEIMNEKVQTVVRGTMINYARARGYPEALVRAMVTKEVEVFRVQMPDEPPGTFTYMTGAQLNALTVPERQAIERGGKQLIVPSGELLTMNGQQAVEFGFARQTVASPEELYQVLGFDAARVKRLFPSAAERLVNVLDAFSPVLIVAGFVLLFLELMQPGLGLPGILGVACFVAFFMIKVSLHYASIWEVLLFVAGLALLLVEIFVIPGFGVVGISGIVLMFVALVLAFQQFNLPRTPMEAVAFQYNLLKVVASLAASAVGMAVVLRLVPAMPGLRRIMNVYSLSAARAGEMQEMRTPGLSNMVGEVGVAVTALRPAGRAEFGDARLDVVTEGEFIEKGQAVRIEAVRGNRIVVSRCEEP